MNQSVFIMMFDEDFQPNSWNNLPRIQILLIISLSVLALIANMDIIYLLSWLPRSRVKRPTNILTGHLSALLILTTFIMLWDFGGRLNLLETRPGFCELRVFLTNTLKYVFGFNVVALTYERMRMIKVTFCKFHVFRTIFWMWVSGIVGAAPKMLLVELGPIAAWNEPPKCKRILLHGSLFKDELLNVGIFVVFHMLPIAYMAQGVYKVSGRPDLLFQLKPIQKPSIRKRVQSLRFICVNSSVFIFVWIALGGVSFISNAMLFDEPLLLKSGVHVVYLLYFIFNPLLHLLLNEDFSRLPKFFGGYKFCHKISNNQGVQIEEPFEISPNQNEICWKNGGIGELFPQLEKCSSQRKWECSKGNSPETGSVAPPPSPQTALEEFPARNYVVADVTVHQLDCLAADIRKENAWLQLKGQQKTLTAENLKESEVEICTEDQPFEIFV